jgi:hypothetical protein
MKFREKQEAAILIEFAIVFPVFLLLIFFLYWLGILLHARETLYSAVTHGVHMGKLRGNYIAMQNMPESTSSKGLLPYIDKYIETGIWQPRLSYLLATPDQISEGINVEEKMNSFMHQSCEQRVSTHKNKAYNACFYPRANLQNLPREAIYSLVFISSDLKRSLGNLIRMPCDVNPDPNTLDTSATIGCLKCNLLPLVEMGLDTCDQALSSCNTILSDQNIPRDRFGIECSYRLPTFILQGLFKIIGLGHIADGVVLKAKEWVFLDISEFCLNNPDDPECFMNLN